METAEPRISPAVAWARALQSVAALMADRSATLPARLDGLAALHGARPALSDGTRTLTYADLVALRNQLARWALRHTTKPGVVVGIVLRNSAAYPALWLGINFVGRVAALLNPDLTGASLRHAIAASGATCLIAEIDLIPQLRALGVDLPLWHLPHPNAPSANTLVLDFDTYSAAPFAPDERPAVALDDLALLIFTSGTTGLPKAARILHARILEWSGWFAAMMSATEDDRLYNCLPCHHSTGGVLGIGAMLISGGSVVIRPRFSASRFWHDIAETRCTIFLYIGELCRYLLATPGTSPPPTHNLRLCCGNGLRLAVWQRFAARFAIPRILEFYASTEGNVSLTNVEGRPGAVGRLPPFLAHRPNVELLACNPATGELLRDEHGRPRRADPDEPGEAIGRINGGINRFDGYTDPAATEQKILRHLFAPGDAWFRTGDVMRRDAAGFFTFIDRIGDTFRWKGENVSCTEVADVIGAVPGVAGVTVYGVEVPGEEGRAGMAALTIDPDVFSLTVLHAALERDLPPAARPQFLRVCQQLDSTATFKPIKARLVSEGFAVNEAGDPLYQHDARAGGYLPLG